MEIFYTHYFNIAIILILKIFKSIYFGMDFIIYSSLQKQVLVSGTLRWVYDLFTLYATSNITINKYGIFTVGLQIMSVLSSDTCINVWSHSS
jgi:hypothetical protein